MRENSEITTVIEDAKSAAKDNVANGLFATWTLVDDEPPYYGDDHRALLGAVYGDEIGWSPMEPWAADIASTAAALGRELGLDEVELWTESWRDEIYRLGLAELGIDESSE